MHVVAWLLFVWGAQADSPDAHSLASLYAVYTSEQKCVDAGIARTDAKGKYAQGVHYRCDSLPLDPPITQPYDARDYRSVSGSGR